MLRHLTRAFIIFLHKSPPDMKRVVAKYILITVALSSSAITHASAQQVSDTTRRNTLKLDVTSYWLYRNAIVFSYERVMKPYQTLGITAGIQEFPTLTDGFDSVVVRKTSKAKGFKVGAEYRFYLRKENKFAAPRGVFIGPYATWHSFKNSRDLEVTTDGNPELAEMTTSLSVLNIGVQLGYQFVFNDRWTVDLVLIGPSVSNYRLTAELDGNFSFDPDDVRNEVVRAMIEKFPALKDLIEEGEFDNSGKLNTWAYGYRYQLQVGYRFGRKKK